MKNIISSYTSERDPTSREVLFDLLVEKTTDENYLEVLKILESEEGVLELEISMVIEAIATPNRKDIIPIIKKMLAVSTDEDVLEDLNDALKKIDFQIM